MWKLFAALLFWFPTVISAAPEIHAVGVYQGSKDDQSSFEGGFARVIVDRPEATVVLSLNSLEPVRWIIEATPTTKVEHVLLHGAEPSASEVFLNGVDFSPQILDKLPYVWRDEGREFRDVITALTSMFEIDALASFQVNYRPPSDPFLIDRVTQEPKLSPNFPKTLVRPDEVPESLAQFMADDANTDRRTVKFTYEGFTLTENNQETLIPLGKGLPRLRHPSDAAHDKAGGRLFGVTHSNEGYIYQYDLSKQRWSFLASKESFSAETALYDEYHDQLVLGVESLRTGIALFDLQSGRLLKVPLKNEDLIGYNDLYALDSEPVFPLRPIAVSKNMLLARAEKDKRFYPESTASRTYLIDMLSGEATLVAYENEK